MNNLDKLDKILEEASRNKKTITIQDAMRIIWQVMDTAEKNVPMSDKEKGIMLSLATSFIATIHLQTLLDEGATEEEIKEKSGADFICMERKNIDA